MKVNGSRSSKLGRGRTLGNVKSKRDCNYFVISEISTEGTLISGPSVHNYGRLHPRVGQIKITVD